MSQDTKHTPSPNIVTGQQVTEDQVRRTKTLRQNMTPAEKILWDQLRNNRLIGLHFRRQQFIHGYIADFYCHAAGVIVEVDGSIHAEQVEYDAVRDEILTAQNLIVLRFTNDAVKTDIYGVLQQISQVCRDRLS